MKGFVFWIWMEPFERRVKSGCRYRRGHSNAKGQRV